MWALTAGCILFGNGNKNGNPARCSWAETGGHLWHTVNPQSLSLCQWWDTPGHTSQYTHANTSECASMCRCAHIHTSIKRRVYKLHSPSTPLCSCCHQPASLRACQTLLVKLSFVECLFKVWLIFRDMRDCILMRLCVWSTDGGFR